MKMKFLLLLSLFLAYTAQAQTAQELLKTGNAKFQQQKYMDAMADYKRAIALDKNFAKAYHNLGNVQYLLQDYSNALKNFDKAITLNPKEAEPYQTRGAAYIALQKYKEAQQDLEKAIALNPKNALAFFQLGELLWATKKETDACVQWKKSLELGYKEAKGSLQKHCDHPAENHANVDVSALETLLKSGETKLELRDYTGAVRDFNQVLNIDEKNVRALFGRGSAEFAQGKHTEACQDWQKCVQLGYKEAEHMIKDVCH
ncbi:MAG: tetratricopeptide repeat protein [Bacteroidetes bacterium]|nr:MAG: tetratricopeptide repeat protein [Bacteroidota bacterium]